MTTTIGLEITNLNYLELNDYLYMSESIKNLISVSSLNNIIILFISIK